MIDKAHGYGYRHIGFILDRGYFSKRNLEYMEKNGYSFLIMVKGMKDFIREIVIENQGSLENSRGKYIDRYDLYGTTVRRLLYEGDTKKRNIHIYYSDGKAYGEKQEMDAEEHTPAEKISGRMCWERMCSIWTGDHKVFLSEF